MFILIVCNMFMFNLTFLNHITYATVLQNSTFENIKRTHPTFNYDHLELNQL